ncbi:MAG: DUF1902 domain-containing protein [Clostridiales bacterium]|nr:DUF1902 domain-containing protein [Clostridiales bacterium]
MKEYIVDLFWDNEAEAWGAVCDDIPLALESESLDGLIERVRIATPEILELNGKTSEQTMLHFKAERLLQAI